MEMPFFGVLYACLGLASAALCPVYCKRAVHRVAPAVSALLFLFTLAFFLGAAALMKGEALSALSVAWAAPRRMLLSGACFALGALFLFRALPMGSLMRSLAVLRFTVLYPAVRQLILGERELGLFPAAFLLLILLGFVFMLADSEERNPTYWILILLSAALLYAGDLLCTYPDGSIGLYTGRLGSSVVACAALLVLALIGGSAGGLRRTSPITVVYAPAAAACFGAFVLCILESGASGFAYLPQILLAALLPVSAISTLLFTKDRASALYPLGLILFTAGLYGLYYWRT